MSFFHMTNGKNQKVKNIDKAHYLVCGIDPDGEILTIGDRDRAKSGPAIRSFGDGVKHGIYGHPETKEGEHYYTKADLNAPSYENAGACKRNGDWMQVDVLDGDTLLSEILPSPDFPDGAFLRKTKHRYYNMLLKGYVLRIRVCHLRQYVTEQQFILQWQLVDDGEPAAAWDIRKKNIRHAKAGRAVRKTLRDVQNGKGNGNWDQVVEQMEDPEKSDTGTDDVEPEETVSVGGSVLLIADYNNKENAVNMYDLKAGVYTMRIGVLPYPQPWDSRNPGIVEKWEAFRGANYKVDLR